MRMKKINWIADYLFICSADSLVQTRAIADSIRENFNYQLRSWEGYQEGKWVLMDYGAEVMVHIFHQPTRDFYNLERLWAEIPGEKLSKKGERAPKKETSAEKV